MHMTEHHFEEKEVDEKDEVEYVNNKKNAKSMQVAELVEEEMAIIQ